MIHHECLHMQDNLQYVYSCHRHAQTYSSMKVRLKRWSSHLCLWQVHYRVSIRGSLEICQLQSWYTNARETLTVLSNIWSISGNCLLFSNRYLTTVDCDKMPSILPSGFNMLTKAVINHLRQRVGQDAWFVLPLWVPHANISTADSRVASWRIE